jgi:PAS domain S-box-containing protein/excisionase family DNA binding protein
MKKVSDDKLPELLTINDVSKILKCSKATLRNWDKDGTLKAIRIGKNKIRRYKKEDLHRMLGNKTHSMKFNSPSEKSINREIHRLNSEDYLRLIFEQIKDYAIFSMDINGVILSWNKGAERILGYKEEEVLGKNFSLFFTKEDTQNNKPQRELSAALNKKSVLNENWSVAKGNRLFWSSGVSTAIRDEKGKILGLVKIFRDRTEIKDIEQKKDQYVSLISHELKTPITSIKMYTQILQRKLEQHADESVSKALSHIKSQTDRLTELIGSLLEKSKIRARGFTYKDADFDLEDAVKESAENIRHAKASHEIIIKGKITKKINADKERIQQVFENLLSNAIKYSPDAQKVMVYLKSDNKSATVCVEDFGFGISQENIDNLFMPFFRAEDTQREAFPSIGLGLFISSEIIKHYNGKISVKSEKDKGSTFCFTIPFGSK